MGARHLDVSVLHLKKIWNPEDSKLFIEESNRFTALGFQTYWEAIDCTVKFCDTTILRRVAKLEFKKIWWQQKR